MAHNDTPGSASSTPSVAAPVEPSTTAASPHGFDNKSTRPLTAVIS
ncbi:MAG: hypothetical protein LBH76_01290 [Propionibacteriaceae bacterium]|nr:hypothetical protein [Propionibacteriaceae bacterium]